MGSRNLGGSEGAAAAAGAGEPVGAEAGVGLGTGGAKGTSLLLCSWLRWRPETLAELQVLDSGLSFVGTPLGVVGEKSFSDPTSDTDSKRDEIGSEDIQITQAGANTKTRS